MSDNVINQEIIDIKNSIEQKNKEINELVEKAKKLDSRLCINFYGEYKKHVNFDISL